MKIVWSEPAIADLDAIQDYIARDSPHYATRVAQRLVESAEPLRDHLQLGRVLPEGDGRHREVLLAPYRILYRVEAEGIYIVRVVHGARNLAALWESEGRDEAL